MPVTIYSCTGNPIITVDQDSLVGVILPNSNLISVRIVNKDLTRSTLSGSVLRGADLANANFSESDLSRCDFTNATVFSTLFINADLHFADFSGADLNFSNFNGANLRGANFTNAKLGNALFEDAILEGALLPLPSRFEMSYTLPDLITIGEDTLRMWEWDRIFSELGKEDEDLANSYPLYQAYKAFLKAITKVAPPPVVRRSRFERKPI